jgi:hypothetical protein
VGLAGPVVAIWCRALVVAVLAPPADSLTQLSHYRAFGDMRLAEFRGNTARLSICGAKPVRTER